MREEGAALKGSGEPYPLLLAWRQPRLTAGGAGTFKPRCLLGELLALDASAAQGGPREWVGGRAFELLGSLGPGAGAGRGQRLPPCPAWQFLKPETP